MAVFTILLNGDVEYSDRLKQQLADSRVIAADGAIRHAKPLNLKPELWLGDFDSTAYEDGDNFADVARLNFPEIKDFSDGELAIHEAIKRGATSLILCGAFGGHRFDHALTHVFMALKLVRQGFKVWLTSGHQEGQILIGPTTFSDWPDHTQFSLVALSPLGGLSIKGAQWLVHDSDVEMGRSLTLSNRIDGTLWLQLCSGEALIMANFDH